MSTEQQQTPAELRARLEGQIDAFERLGQVAVVIREMALVVALQRLGGGRFRFSMDDYVAALNGEDEGFALGREGADVFWLEPSTRGKVLAEVEAMRRADQGEGGRA